MTHDEYLIERETLTKRFVDEVMSMATELDPGKCEDWRSLAIGWGVAQNLTPECAVAFSNYIYWLVNHGPKI